MRHIEAETVLRKILENIGKETGIEVEIEIENDGISGRKVIEIIMIRDRGDLDSEIYGDYRKVFSEIRKFLEEKLSVLYNVLKNNPNITMEQLEEKVLLGQIKTTIEVLGFWTEKIQREAERFPGELEPE